MGVSIHELGKSQALDEGALQRVVHDDVVCAKMCTLYGVSQAPRDLQMRSILDPAEPSVLRPAFFRALHSALQPPTRCGAPDSGARLSRVSGRPSALALAALSLGSDCERCSSPSTSPTGRRG